jgi:predicted ferric reductase
MIDHTLSWEIARVGGMLALVLSSASVLIGLALSLKVRSTRFPRFVTNELHRYVSLLTLAFLVVHGLAVWLDPFTGFTPAEVLVPLAAHYRPLWIAMGIVSGYLMLAVYLSENVRGRIGYAWWRRFHGISFLVFLLGMLHGIGTGSDTAAPWALATYLVCGGSVAVLLMLRLMAMRPSDARDVAVMGVAFAVMALVVLTLVGPMRAGWNEVANNGNGSGASAAWQAAQAASN